MSYYGRIPLDREKGFSRRIERFEKRGRRNNEDCLSAEVKEDRGSQGVGSHITP